MKRRILLITLLISIFTIVKSQDLKTFDGKYQDGQIESGYATYTYYVDKKSGDYVKNGNFKYTKKIKGFHQTISGKFKDGKRNGIWSYSIKATDNGNDATNHFLTGTITLNANYKNGLPNGTWKYSSTRKYRKKKFSIFGYTWGSFGSPINAKMTITFKDGLLSGPFYIQNGFTEETVKGNCNENGFLIGEHKYTSLINNIEVEEYFNDGILNKWIVRDLKTGSVKQSEIDDEEKIKMKKDYVNGIITETQLNAMGYRADTVEAMGEYSNEIRTSLKMLIYSDELLWNYIPGDITCELGILKHKGGFAVVFPEFTYKKLEDLNLYQTAERKFNAKQHKRAQMDYKSALYFDKRYLKKEDQQKILDKIKTCEPLIVLAEKQDEFTKEKRLLIESTKEKKNLLTKNQKDIKSLIESRVEKTKSIDALTKKIIITNLYQNIEQVKIVSSSYNKLLKEIESIDSKITSPDDVRKCRNELTEIGRKTLDSYQVSLKLHEVFKTLLLDKLNGAIAIDSIVKLSEDSIYKNPKYVITSQKQEASRKLEQTVRNLYVIQQNFTIENLNNTYLSAKQGIDTSQVEKLKSTIEKERNLINESVNNAMVAFGQNSSVKTTYVVNGKIKKKVLYQKYQIAYQHYFKKLSTEPLGISDYAKYSNDLKALTDFMILSVETDTKALEKELKMIFEPRLILKAII